MLKTKGGHGPTFLKGVIYFAVHLVVLKTVIEGFVLLYFSYEINKNP